jgi:hypothetical protein
MNPADRKAWRVEVMVDTKKKIKKSNYAEFLGNAAVYLESVQTSTRQARSELENGPTTVSVLKRDCLEAAADIIQNFGVKPAVLNMANAHFFGGGYLHGAGAQEENIFRRTGCYLNTGMGILSASPDKNVVNSSKYTSDFSDQVFGLHGHVPVFEGVCFKTEEADGYRIRDDVFPFFELRSAAQNLKSEYDVFDEALCETQIRAQFRSLAMIRAQAVVLSAFGCGAFHNPPDRVAAVYKRVIDEVIGRNECPNLKKIVFALINPNDARGDPGYTLTLFKEILNFPSALGRAPAARPASPLQPPSAARPASPLQPPSAARSASPAARARSASPAARARSASPAARPASPAARPASPAARSASPAARSASPAARPASPAETATGLPSMDGLKPGVYMLLQRGDWSKLKDDQERAYREALTRAGSPITIHGRDLGAKYTGKYKFTRDGDGNMYYSFAGRDALMLIKEIASNATKRRRMGGRRSRKNR